MKINWYPGHMHKASKEIKEALPHIDLIIEVLDARIPYSSQNPVLSDLRQETPCIRILNKSDLADPALTERWQTFLEQEQGVKTLATRTDQPEKIKQIIDLCRKMLADKVAANRVIRTMIMGIPNVGKSTLINILAGKTIAKTGNEPAVTQRQQRINLGQNVILSDTPGVLWPNVENINSGYRLAITGAIKDTAMHYDDVAFFAADYLLSRYPECLKQRFQIDDLPETEVELMSLIGQKRGCLKTGKQIDMDKTGKILLQEIRSGKLGQISWESPEIVNEEQAELERLRAAKAAKKAARKKKRSFR
ncbi:ribosome biogenesis GTPase YlqF [methane-oxidizing endosymbiont of Gigantopelta aegis]|uniref:ribosome biogenesis GTPase YlqF n=1 Tax=methane-oxidizing endosymbiont of Gigantopelta aegis TaxID=2794938 RepID=UPI0018DD43CB|nr:ribosome biogenesis GTPase YlqF [methane-oxidizing endosymbiont of Gigantopelta aegis]